MTNLWIAAVILLAAAGISFPFLGRTTPAIRFALPGILTAVALVLAALSLTDDGTGDSVETADPDDALAGLNRPPAPDPVAPDIEAEGADLIEQGRNAANAGRDDDARELFARAMDLFQAAGLNAGMGEVKLQTGILDQIVGQGERARDVFAEAQGFFVAAADPVGQARVALALGNLEKAQFNNDEAFAAFSNAQALFHDQGDWSAEAEALLGRGHAERRLHLVLASRRSVARAMAIYEILDDSAGLRAANQSVDELQTYQDQNDRQEEELIVERTNAQQAGDPSAEADVLVRIGELDHRGGHIESARDAFTQAAALWAGERSSAGQGRALAMLGDLERAVENFEAAAVAYGAALAFYQDAGDDVGAATVLVGQGALASMDHQVGGNHYQEAQASFEAAGHSSGQGQVLLGLGQLDHNAGQDDEARLKFQGARAMFADAADTRGQGEAELALGDLDREAGNLAAAVAAYERSLDLFHTSLYRPGEAWAHVGLAAALSETNPREASVNFRLAAGIFDDLDMDVRRTQASNAAAALD
ncbi:MAG: hypothetical protein HOB82_04775 [Alphaproteobacteria bacterium]|nr:hypothetical protein [Alphaproteobacteria bacterium]